MRHPTATPAISDSHLASQNLQIKPETPKSSSHIHLQLVSKTTTDIQTNPITIRRRKPKEIILPPDHHILGLTERAMTRLIKPNGNPIQNTKCTRSFSQSIDSLPASNASEKPPITKRVKSYHSLSMKKRVSRIHPEDPKGKTANPTYKRT